MRFINLKKLKPTGQNLILFLLFLLVIDLILLVFISRKPICFESSLVSQIEWVNENESTSAVVYHCNYQKLPSEENIIYEHIDEIQKKLAQSENLLKSNFKPMRPIRLKIKEGEFGFIQSSPDLLAMDQKNFFSKSLLFERGYLKTWLQQFQESPGLGFYRLEVFTNFILWSLGVNGHFDLQWQNILTRWPLMGTSWSGYCKSPVKDDIYSQLCLNKTINQSAELMMSLPTAFWISLKLWQSFQLLPLADQIKFYKSIGPFIENLSQAESAPITETTLKEIEKFIKSEINIWRQAFEKMGYKEWGSNFEAKVNIDLESASGNLGRVDVLLKKTGAWTVNELNSYQILSLQEANYRIMGLNDEGIWSFPWLAPIKPSAFPSIKSEYLIWLSCDWPYVQDILDLQEHSDKLIFVHECNEKAKHIILSGLLHRGLQFFSLDNREIEFIQINIEALRFLMKLDPILRDKKLGSFQQVNERKNYIASKTNWSSALWNEKYRAYEVQGTIDVIEWFKLPENTWPDFE